MRRIRCISLVFLAVLLLTSCVAAWADEVTNFTPSELDEILAPIALYPDPLLAQIFPASTFPDQLSQAATLTQLKGGSEIIDNQDWDVSVKAIAHYPTILNMMVDKSDWTIAIGQAYTNQADDVMKSIQRLRAKAKLMGYLNSNDKQQVIVNPDYISIVPVQTQYIYVPVYNPDVVFVQARYIDDDDIFYFSTGLLIGVWLNRDCDWPHHRIYYHGWIHDGWVKHSRPYVRIDNRVYINNYYLDRPVTGNRRVTNRDISVYKKTISDHAGQGHYEAVKPLTRDEYLSKVKSRTNPSGGNKGNREGTDKTYRKTDNGYHPDRIGSDNHTKWFPGENNIPKVSRTDYGQGDNNRSKVETPTQDKGRTEPNTKWFPDGNGTPKVQRSDNGQNDSDRSKEETPSQDKRQTESHTKWFPSGNDTSKVQKTDNGQSDNNSNRYKVETPTQDKRQTETSTKWFPSGNNNTQRVESENKVERKPDRIQKSDTKSDSGPFSKKSRSQKDDKD